MACRTRPAASLRTEEISPSDACGRYCRGVLPAARRSCAARRPSSILKRCGLCHRVRTVRRPLLPRRRVARRVQHAGWTGLRGRARGVCGARSRRIILAGVPGSSRQAGCPPARPAGVPDVREPGGRPLSISTQDQGLEFVRKGTDAFLRRFSFGARSVVIMAEINQDFFLRKFRWFIFQPNRYKMAAGSPKTRVATDVFPHDNTSIGLALPWEGSHTGTGSSRLCPGEDVFTTTPRNCSSSGCRMYGTNRERRVGCRAATRRSLPFQKLRFHCRRAFECLATLTAKARPAGSL